MNEIINTDLLNKIEADNTLSTKFYQYLVKNGAIIDGSLRPISFIRKNLLLLDFVVENDLI